MCKSHFSKVTSLIFILAMMIFVSCKWKHHQEIDSIEIADDYIDALNASDYDKLVGLFVDSIRFNEMDYIRTFSREEYRSLFQWDSVFAPTYRILNVKKAGRELHLKVSKECERINFLHEKPFVTNEIMQIKDGGIYQIDVIEYVDFNDSLWVDKREKLVSWIEKNHPGLNGFIYDQTKEGAVKFRKAIAFYKNSRDFNNQQENN
ncbi:MAG: hypothetical protein ACE37L_08930 [Allomuricauda sp.]